MKDRALEQIMLGANNGVQTYLDRYSIADLANTEQTSKADEIRESPGIVYARRSNGRELGIASSL